MTTRFSGIALILSVLAAWPLPVVSAPTDQPSTSAPATSQASPVAPPTAVYFASDGPPVQDQVPCILTQQQSYGGRALTAQFQTPTSPAEKLAQAAEAAAAAEKVAQAAAAAAMKPSTPPTTSTSTATQGADKTASNPSATAKGKPPAIPDPYAQQKIDALTKFADLVRQKLANKSLYELKLELPSIQSTVVDTKTPAAEQAALNSAIGSAISQGTSQVVPYQRPPDISCSMSILSWDETHKAFGRTIADTYLAAQITIRNLSPNNEFLVHDAELAVDAYGAQLARFQVGHEKEIVRGVLQYGQNYDRQHIFINTVTGIGTIMGAVVAVPSPAIDALTGATGAYTGGLMPVLKTLIPDLTTQNLNMLNDLAFSAASASKVVVPKSGSVPVVLFIPVKPLEEACWLQIGYNFSRDWVTGDACGDVLNKPTKKGHFGSWFTSSDSNFKVVRFKHWTPVQVHALELHSFGLIAGVHIQETGQPATLSAAPNCANAPTDSSGAYLQYALPHPFSCTLTGTNLNTMTTLRLKPPDNTKAIINFKSSVSGDNTTATAVLQSSDYSKIDQPSYELFAVDNSGVESDLNRTMNFRLAPTVGPVTWNADGSGTLTGTNLASITQVNFYTVPANPPFSTASVTEIDPAGASLKFAIPTTALTTGTTYTVGFGVTGVSTPYQPAGASVKR